MTRNERTLSDLWQVFRGELSNQGTGVDKVEL
jgi:hypothetical protein